MKEWNSTFSKNQVKSRSRFLPSHSTKVRETIPFITDSVNSVQGIWVAASNFTRSFCSECLMCCRLLQSNRGFCHIICRLFNSAVFVCCSHCRYCQAPTGFQYLSPYLGFFVLGKESKSLPWLTSHKCLLATRVVALGHVKLHAAQQILITPPDSDATFNCTMLMWCKPMLLFAWERSTSLCLLSKCFKQGTF